MENYSASLQENIITLLVFKDDVIPLVKENVDVSLFDNRFYKRIAKVSVDYFNEFKQAPKKHIYDLLEKELLSGDGKAFVEILKQVEEIKDFINVEFVLTQLEKFIKIQSLKQSIKKAYELVEIGNLEKAEEVIDSYGKVKISSFDAGIKFDDFTSIDLLGEEEDEDTILTGIKYLDVLGHVPHKKELFIMMAQSGYGKSWFLVHLAKFALLQGKKVLYITLELSDVRLVRRFIQCLFGVTIQNEFVYKLPIFEQDDSGYLSNIKFKEVFYTKSLLKEKTVKEVTEKLKYFRNKSFVIKSFPSGTLSVRGLRSYIENLSEIHNFVPDIILLDYLDLMEVDPERMRIDLGRNAVDLRGIADEMNLAMVTVAQTNKVAEDTKLITRKHIAEDFSRIRTADIFITYNRTVYEKKYNLARLYVDKSRNNKDGDLILISQNYDIGQFCLSSAVINNSKYEEIFENMNGGKN
ncbi:MAG TPA: DnaB-like helicase C-terminal domain-containing protein [Caldisericia bacterium]|nr:DnaB-like helicase C-terminal domain-containing protein [Caldisericia bacterium]